MLFLHVRGVYSFLGDSNCPPPVALAGEAGSEAPAGGWARWRIDLRTQRSPSGPGRRAGPPRSVDSVSRTPGRTLTPATTVGAST